MNTAALHPGDEVEVDIRGRRFPARVTGTPAGSSIPIEPLVSNNSFRSARLSQVKQVLRHAGAEQLQLGEATS